MSSTAALGGKLLAGLRGPAFFSAVLPLLQGIVIGFAISVPVGPIGLLCIRRSLAEGRLVGFVCGLGAAAADVLYMIVAALGLTAVTNALVEHRGYFQLGGGVLMLAAGLVTFLSRPATEAAPATRASSLPMAFGSTLVLTLMNPSTIVSFIAILAAVGVNASRGLGSGVALILGVFIGSASWWLILSLTAGRLGRSLKHGGLLMLNRVSGGLIIAFGAWHLFTWAQGLAPR